MKKSLFLTICIALSVMLISTGCQSAQAESGTSQQTEAVQNKQEETVTSETEDVSPVQQLMDSMTLREKIGQMFFIRPDCLDLTQTKQQIADPYVQGVTQLSEDMISVLKNYPAGGVVLFSKNMENPDQLKAFNDSLQQSSDIPLFISVDEEGGAVSRIANHSEFDVEKYESAAAMGDTGDPENALAMGKTIGEYLGKYGFNMNFAPVADVNTNPDNPVIGSRAFSDNPATAAEMADAVAQGLKNQGIIPTYKHFPGHGDTAEDSHSSIAVSFKTINQMEICEWLAFKNAAENDLVMVGHIAVPEITGDMTPSTLSYMVVTDILKNQLGFEGLVITDAMEMGAVTENYKGTQAAVLAINAGCDVILCPDGFTEVFDGVVKAVENGEISESRIDESVEKILEFKISYGILK